MGVTQGHVAKVRGARRGLYIPEGKKGKGKFYRKGTAGGWRKEKTPRRRR